jgi:hypothetical protein
MWLAIPRHAGAGWPGTRTALACVSSGGAGFVCGDGGHPVQAGEKRLPARSVFLGCIALTALVQLGLWSLAADSAVVVDPRWPAVCVLLCVQCAGGQSAQHGLKAGAGTVTGCRRRRLQHLAVLGIFCRWHGGRVARQTWRCQPAVRRVWRTDDRLVAVGVAYAASSVGHTAGQPQSRLKLKLLRDSPWHL